VEHGRSVGVAGQHAGRPPAIRHDLEGERALEDGEAPALGQGVAEGAHHLGPGRVARVQDARPRVRGLPGEVELARRVAVEAGAE
jgi:hypothetical protein